VSTDKEFASKAADVVGLYLNSPVNAMVLSVDEKPSIQVIERTSGYVETDSGKVVRGLKSTYKRHGTLNLFAALEVGTGQVKTKFTGDRVLQHRLARFGQVLVHAEAELRDALPALDGYLLDSHLGGYR
jgi:hypothetical protein